MKSGCGGYFAHPFANQMAVLLIASYFSELWHAQIKECKSISRVYLIQLKLGVHLLIRRKLTGRRLQA
jgi:hypothetical protein